MKQSPPELGLSGALKGLAGDPLLTPLFFLNFTLFLIQG